MNIKSSVFVLKYRTLNKVTVCVEMIKSSSKVFSDLQYYSICILRAITFPLYVIFKNNFINRL